LVFSLFSPVADGWHVFSGIVMHPLEVAREKKKANAILIVSNPGDKWAAATFKK
jgi:hypothetical protein